MKREQILTVKARAKISIVYLVIMKHSHTVTQTRAVHVRQSTTQIKGIWTSILSMWACHPCIVMRIPMFPVCSCFIQVRIPGSKVSVPVCGRYVTGPFPVSLVPVLAGEVSTGTGSSRWSGSPVPDLAGEVAHRLLGTGHRLEPNIR
jgi:hypothetical protein